MIAEHQPTIFGNKVIAAISSIKNGTQSHRNRPDAMTEEEVAHNQMAFLHEAGGVSHEQATVVLVDYDTDDFTRYREVERHEKGDVIAPEAADGLVATDTGHALFLPLADCVGAILYAPDKKVLMVTHLGRHSTEQYGAAKSVQYLVSKYGIDPKQMLVWISPAVGKATYPLRKFDNRGLHEVNYEHFKQAGVPAANIEIAEVDTAVHPDYYSHSQFRKGRAEKHGRHAIVAMMPEMVAQGEPAR